ncbi:MAG: ADP-glyceromanno-heptose 6-epimerase [Acetobacterales bacterium]
MILVTGGAGFIGSNLVAALTRRGSGRIVVCDRLCDAKRPNLRAAPQAEVIAPEDLQDFLAGADLSRAGRLAAIFHMGAISSTTESDMDALFEANVALSRMLWRVAAERSIPLIYASSAATYGDGGLGFDDDGSIDGIARLRPLNPYGWSKQVFDLWVAWALAGRNAAPPQWAGLRFFNVYGPNEYHKKGQQSVVPQVARQAMAGQPARLFRSHRTDVPDGGQKRDFIWVGDCVDVMLWLYDNPGVSGLFNVGTGKARSFADLAAAVFAALGEPPRIDYVDTPAAIRARYQYFTEARMQRLRTAGYDRPFTTLEDGVREYVARHLATNDPYLAP